jgi:hypothetical protein
MDRSRLPRELRPFIDDAGRLCRWPSRQKVQRMAAELLAGRFEPGREYSEPEVNFLLMDAHTFGDWAMLRRMLCDWKHLEREADGTRYRLRADRPVEYFADQPAAG